MKKKENKVILDSTIYNKKGELRKRKPKSKIDYFTIENEEAIILYNNTEDVIIKNRIFEDKIYFPFWKLAENLIHTFKFYYTEVEELNDLKHEVVIFLLSKIHLYNQSKGKAYSYFGTIAKRYLIIQNQKNYKKVTEKSELEHVDDDNSTKVNINSQSNIDNVIEFFVEFEKYLDLNINNIFSKNENEKLFSNAIYTLVKRREFLEVMNKKALYLYIREITDLSSHLITKGINKFKELFRRLFIEYNNNGCINMKFI